jgi:hypothetical protein
MKELNCFDSTRNNADSVQSFRLGSKSGIAMISGLLISSLLAVGCSKQKSTPASNETQTSINQTTLNQSGLNQSTAPAPVVAATTTTTTSAPVVAAKKVVRKRPSNLTYKDQTYGVSFRYPWTYGLKNGDRLDSAAVDFVQPGGVKAVAVEVPKGFYPDTDLASAYFLVNVNQGLTEAECGQFAAPQAASSDQSVAQPAKVALGGLEMQEVENISGEDTKQDDTKYYHLFQNGNCYEFALSLSTEAVGDDETVRPVEREKVFRRLETILATVKIEPQAASQVAAAPAAAPSEQTSVAVNPVPQVEVK